jgi:hypothetical protein
MFMTDSRPPRCSGKYLDSDGWPRQCSCLATTSRSELRDGPGGVRLVTVYLCGECAETWDELRREFHPPVVRVP